jgi:3-hydroxybutyryl-CoA dehydratase
MRKLTGVTVSDSFYTRDYPVTKKKVLDFAEATGDLNPIHFDEEYAKTTQFGGCIVHGMLIAGFISTSLTDHYGNGTIYLSQELKFKAPVRVGDTVTIEFKDSEEIVHSSSPGRVQLKTIASVGDKVVIEGTAKIITGEKYGST